MSARTLPTARRLDPSPGAVAGALLVLLSALASALARGALGASVRVRWTVGPSHHLGPERLPTDPVLVAFPVALGVTYVGLAVLGRFLDRHGDGDEHRPAYDVVVVGVLSLLLVVQLSLLALNLA